MAARQRNRIFFGVELEFALNHRREVQPADVSQPQQVEQHIGHFFAAMRVDLFRPVDEFKAEMDRLIRQLRGLPRARGVDRIYVAGEKELEAEEENRRLGIPLPRPHREALQALAARLGLGDRAAFLARP